MRTGAIVAAIVGLVMVYAAVADGGPGPEPIPLHQNRLATPVLFPTTPPIRSTPMFVSTSATPPRLSNWQMRTLMRFYIEPQPTPEMGAS